MVTVMVVNHGMNKLHLTQTVGNIYPGWAANKKQYHSWLISNQRMPVNYRNKSDTKLQSDSQNTYK